MDNHDGGSRSGIKNFFSSVKRVSFSTISAALSLFFVVGCAWLLMNVFSYSFRDNEVVAKERDLIVEYENGTTDFKSSALDGIYSIRRIYMIPETQITAPKPDQNAFGSVKKLSSLEEIFAKAEEYQLIKADEIIAAKESTPRSDGQTVRYYLDETILTVSWKTLIGEQVCNFTEVVIAHPSQFRKHLTENKFASGKRKTVSTMSKELNAVVGMSADFYAYRPVGVVVHNGEVFRDKVSDLDNCFINSDGDLILAARQSVTEEGLADFVRENDIRFSLSFGPILVENGEVFKDIKAKYALGEVTDNYSRAAIGQYGKLHYLLCTIDGGTKSFGAERVGTDIVELAQIMHKMGCVNAYTLDGGQTATMTVNGKIFNRVGYSSERPISDMIFFATAMPEGKRTEVSE